MYRGGDYKTASSLLRTTGAIPASQLPQSAPLTVHYHYKEYADAGNPDLWGQGAWYLNHVGASRYAVKASDMTAAKMKGYIIGFPGILPCAECSNHAEAYVSYKKDHLDEICSGREKLFEFFWAMHNYVNERKGKPTISLEDAWRMYTGKVRVKVMSYS